MKEKLHPIVGLDAKDIVQDASYMGGYGRHYVNSLSDYDLKSFEYRLYAPDKGSDALRERVKESDMVGFVYPKDKYFSIEKELWRHQGIVRNLCDDGVDIYHGLSGELPSGLRRHGIHGIVTIHDLIFLRHPEYNHFIDNKIQAYKFRVTCREAERIIAVSECVRHDIIEFGHVNPEQVKVVCQGCNNLFTQTVGDDKKTDIRLYYGLPKRYVLNVGSIEERKNVLLAIKALMRLPKEISLVIVGKNTTYMNKVLDFIEMNDLHRRVLIINSVSQSDLPAIYQMAEAFVYPSRYEGFGSSVVEAIHSGLPVVACTGSCLEEAGGPDNLYVAPDDDEAFANAIQKMLVGAEGREERIARSREYVKRFNEEDLVREMLDEYLSLTRW